MATIEYNAPVSEFPIDFELREFLIDREARNLSKRTLGWYQHALQMWRAFAVSIDTIKTEEVTSGTIRRYLLHLGEKGHNAGGVNNLYGALKAFLRWYEVEYAPTGWENPLKRVQTPRRPDEPLEPLSLDHFHKLLATCKPKTIAGDRDKAMLLFLLDTGVRQQELTNLLYGDVDVTTGSVLVRQGKGRKPRTVFIGAKTRRALLAYLRHRRDLRSDSPLWVTKHGGRLTKNGIRQAIRARAALAGIPNPGLHEFRRAFAVNCLRNGMSVIHLQRLLGHTSLVIINRYLKLLTEDLEEAHGRYGVVDNL